MSNSLQPHAVSAVRQASLSFTISQSLLKLLSTESVTPTNHLILCHPLLLLPWVFPASGSFLMSRLFCIRGPKYWSFSFRISPSNEYSGLISFRIEWFNFLTVQRTLKGLLQHDSLKTLFLWRSGFFVVQLSYPYMTLRITIALTIQAFCWYLLTG